MVEKTKPDFPIINLHRENGELNMADIEKLKGMMMVKKKISCIDENFLSKKPIKIKS